MREAPWRYFACPWIRQSSVVTRRVCHLKPMLVARRDKPATFHLRLTNGSIPCVLGVIGIVGAILFISVVILIWRANSLKRKLVNYKHDYTTLQRRSFEIAQDDTKAGQELWDQVQSLSS